MRCCWASLNAQAKEQHWSYEKDELLVILCLKMQHDLRGSMALSVQRILIKIFAIDFKGGGKAQRASVRPSEEEYCHQCQRGRLLEILSLMAKELVAKVADDTNDLETEQ